MGMITKRFHQRTTNRLVEPIRGITRLGVDQVHQLLRHVVEQTPAKTGLLWSGEMLWLFGDAPGPWRVYFGPPARKEPDKVRRIWRADVTLKPSADGTQTLVVVELVQWKTSDGLLVNRREFERFRDDLAMHITHGDPTYTLLGGPAG